MSEKIKGIIIKELTTMIDERGTLTEILRNDDSLFKRFGQIYTSTINPGYVKAWHCHVKQTDNVICISGNVRLGLWDSRKESGTYNKTMGVVLKSSQPCLVQIPPMVYHGFESIGNSAKVTILNIPTELYNHEKPDEIRIDPFDNNIPFNWVNKKGN